MKNQEWEKIKEVFAQAVEQPKSSRPDFLRRICGENPALLVEVESLLSASDEAEHFIDKKDYAAVSVMDANGKDYAGKQFGNYRIIQEIGRGGMGAVFLAQRADGEFEQKVALKIIRHSFADREMEKRFRSERQILAALNHPNIARLLDGGVSQTGEPFLAMEYIEGETILEFAERRNLTVEERLKLFLKVCSAVAFAHRNLIIHRDIKPSNILVDDAGEPKLLDFGLAKILDENWLDASQTETAFRAFTPAYASPEQMHGERVATTSDVYSLGVVLYELLTGEKPFRFEHKSYEEILRSIDSQEPPRPSSVISSKFRVSSFRFVNTTSPDFEQRTTKDEQKTNPKSEIPNPKFLAGDLDNIALMALRREPLRRYQSVEQFAGDIEKHLQGLPVTARPQTVSYRAAKFIQRNTITVAAMGFVILSLMTGLGIALWQANVARQQKTIAEKRFNDVRQLSNALLNDIAPKIENLQGATEARQAIVTQSLKYLDSLAQETEADFALQSELATAYEKVGDIQGNPTNPNLGDMAGAIASYEKAQKIRLKLLEKNPNGFEERRLLAANHQAFGNLHHQSNQLEESARQTEMALSLYEKLAAEQPDSPAMRLALAQITYDVADTRRDNSKYAEAIIYFRKALDLLTPLRDKDAANIQYLKLAGNCYQKMGNSLSWNGQQKEGEAETERAVQIYESLAASHPNDVSINNGLWQTYWMASSTYEEQNDPLSHEYALKALKTIQKIVENDPADTQARKRLARSFSTLGQTSTNTGQIADAVSYLEKAVSETTRLVENDPRSGRTKSDLGTALMRLAEARAKQKDFPGALAELERAERIYNELLELDATDTYSVRNHALIADFRAEIHLEWAKIVDGEKRRIYQRTAKENYERAIEILLRSDAAKSLPEADRIWLEKMQSAVQK